MTIKLPVAADLLETDARLAWRIVDADGVTVPWGTVVAALNATAAPDLRLALENVEAILAEACSSPYDEEWKLISDAWSYVKAILAGETLVETESKTAAEILGLPWDDHDPATEIEAAVSAMGYAEVFGEDTTRHPKCVAPTHDEPGYGINHFVNCPSAAQHRKEKAAP
jgi:hypothetical protein